MSEDFDMGGSGSKVFFGKPIAQMHKVYLCGPIKDPEDYADTFELIRSAGENDQIFLHINSEGGNPFTAIQFLRVLGETKATTIASVEGLCMSAATIIFMGAKHHQITNHSIFMFHNYSNKIEGKGHELYDHVVHVKGWSEKFLQDIYATFLTKEEIGIVLAGKDLYMDSAEVARRLEKRNGEILKKAKAEAKKIRKPRKVLISHRDNVRV